MNRLHNIQMSRPRGGWSLVEMLVVVALITILLGILINTASEGRGPIELTKVTLRAAKAASTEYMAKTGTWINHHDTGLIDWAAAKKQNVTGKTGTAIIANDGTYKGGTAERFVWAALQVESSRKAVFSIDSESLKDFNNNGMYDILDGWGNPVRYAAFVQTDGVAWDDDLPLVGTSSNPQPFFASAGPDGKWGDASQGTNSAQPNADAADNLYSFSLD